MEVEMAIDVGCKKRIVGCRRFCNDLLLELYPE
jgi:hypothetical protein